MNRRSIKPYVWIILLMSLTATGFSADKETPAWITKIKTIINGDFNNEKSLASFGGQVIGILHPSGKYAALDDIGYVEASQGHLIVQFTFSWKGGLVGNDYKTVVNWITSEEGHIGSAVDSDTAPTLVSKEALQKLEDYFKNTFSTAVNNTQQPKKTNRKIKNAKSKAQNPLAAVSAIRTALQNFYAANEGSFPGELTDMVPEYLPSIPSISITPGIMTRAVAHPKTTHEDICSNVTGTGGWLYFNNPKDTGNLGNLNIDSVELSPEGRRWCEY